MYNYITLRERPQLKDRATEWFHSKWGVPKEAYLECMEAYLCSHGVLAGTFAWTRTKS